MKTARRIAIGSAALVSCVAVFAIARAAEGRASPHEDVKATIGGKNITISYGRPFKKGRDIFGKLVPWGEVWRTGADEATTFTTDGDLTLGDLNVPKGTYGLFTLPAEKDWQLIINKTAKQWGAFKYDAKADLGRTKMNVSASDKPVEQFTVSIDAAGKKGTLKLAWDKTVATVDITP